MDDRDREIQEAARIAKRPLVLRPAVRRTFPLIAGAGLVIASLIEIAFPAFPLWAEVGLVALAMLMAVRWRNRFSVTLDAASIRAPNRRGRQARTALEDIDWAKTQCDFNPDRELLVCTLFTKHGERIPVVYGLFAPPTQATLLAALPQLKEQVEAARALKEPKDRSGRRDVSK